MQKSGTLVGRQDLWNSIGEQVYVYLADPRCDYRVWDDIPRDLRLVRYSGPVELVQPFEDKCLELGASLYQGFIPLSATGMDADGDDPMDPDIPGKTIGEAWDEEATKHWVRDGIAILIAIAIGAAIFLAVGFSVHKADAEMREAGAGYSAAEKDLEAEDLSVDTGKAEVRVLGPGSSFEPVEQEEQWVPEPDYGYSEPMVAGGSGYSNDFQSDGVAYIWDQEFTWYSQNVAPGGGLNELNANGRHVDESTGFVVDGDGYIAVASPWGRDKVGTVVETPYGQGKVYDSNEGDSYDLYTDF